MATTREHIQVRQGLKINIDANLVSGEFGFATDTAELFLGEARVLLRFKEPEAPAKP